MSESSCCDTAGLCPLPVDAVAAMTRLLACPALLTSQAADRVPWLDLLEDGNFDVAQARQKLLAARVVRAPLRDVHRVGHIAGDDLEFVDAPADPRDRLQQRL